jgi:hypothetical protein
MILYIRPLTFAGRRRRAICALRRSGHESTVFSFQHSCAYRKSGGRFVLVGDGGKMTRSGAKPPQAGSPMDYLNVCLTLVTFFADSRGRLSLQKIVAAGSKSKTCADPARSPQRAFALLLYFVSCLRNGYYMPQKFDFGLRPTLRMTLGGMIL